MWKSPISIGPTAATDWNWKPMTVRAKVSAARISQRLVMRCCTPAARKGRALSVWPVRAGKKDVPSCSDRPHERASGAGYPLARERAERAARLSLSPRPKHRLDRHARPRRGAAAEVEIGRVHLAGDGVARSNLAEHVVRLVARGGDEVVREGNQF